MYGIEKSPQQVGPLGFTARTELEGLFLCGQSTTSHGVAGVTASGVEAAKAVLGLDRLDLPNCRTRDLLREGGGGMRFVGAESATDVERISGWAEGDEREV